MVVEAQLWMEVLVEESQVFQVLPLRDQEVLEFVVKEILVEQVLVHLDQEAVVEPAVLVQLKVQTVLVETVEQVQQMILQVQLHLQVILHMLEEAVVEQEVLVLLDLVGLVEVEEEHLDLADHLIMQMIYLQICLEMLILAEAVEL